MDVMSLAAKQHAAALADCYAKEIPYWYRLLLDNRQESPAEALGLLTNLARIKDKQQRISRIDRARRAMRLS